MQPSFVSPDPAALPYGPAATIQDRIPGSHHLHSTSDARLAMRPESPGRKLRLLAAGTTLLFVLVPLARAEDAASKNKAGNRLYAQGKYLDAEKAYLEAQAEMPGRPELSYNLGNSLIRQKKYDQALQALRQATGAGDKDLQAKGWYNAGNALFEAGDFSNAAEAYIQALRRQPSDGDAKHNLELALKKKEEQQQGQRQDSGDQQEEGKDKNPSQPQGRQGEQSQNPKGQEPANPQSTRPETPEGAFSRERALQILDALQNQELAEQRRLLERQARRTPSRRDW